jgi:nucleoside-diphosphate-sugar epimerase
MEAVLASTSIDYLVLRLGHVVGRAQPAHQLLPAMVRQVCSGQVRLHRGARRDLIDAADLVTVLDRLLARDVSRTVVNVVSGRSVPIERIVEHIEAALGVRAAHEYVRDVVSQPVSAARLHGLVPEIALTTADFFYYRRILDRYLWEYATPPARVDVGPAVVPS